MKTLVILTAVSIILALGGPLQAVVIIDDFEVGSIDIRDTDTAVNVRATRNELGLDTSHVVGGRRFTQANLRGGAGGSYADADLVTDGLPGVSDDGIQYALDGSSAIFDTEYFPSSLDLSAESQFLVSLSTVDAQMDLWCNIVTNSGEPSEVEDFVTKTVSAAGTVPFLITEFSGLDFEDVDFIQVRVTANTSGLWVIDDIRAVPEPATLSLLTLGGLALLRRRG